MSIVDIQNNEKNQDQTINQNVDEKSISDNFAENRLHLFRNLKLGELPQTKKFKIQPYKFFTVRNSTSFEFLERYNRFSAKFS